MLCPIRTNPPNRGQSYDLVCETQDGQYGAKHALTSTSNTSPTWAQTRSLVLGRTQTP